MEKTLEEEKKEREITENIHALETKIAQLAEKHYEMCGEKPTHDHSHKKTTSSLTITTESHLKDNLFLLLVDGGFFQTLPHDDKTELEYIFSQWPSDPLVPIRNAKQEARSVAFMSDERNEDGRVNFFHYVDYDGSGERPKKLSGQFSNEQTCNVANKGIDRFFAYRPVRPSERDKIVESLEIYSHRKLWKRSLFKYEVLKRLFEKRDGRRKNEIVFRAFKTYLETLLVTKLFETDPKRTRDLASVARDINGYLTERVFDRFEKRLPDKNPLEDFCFGFPSDTVFSSGSVLLTHSKFPNVYFSFKSYLSFREETKTLNENLREDEIRVRYENENKDATDLLLLSIDDAEVKHHWKLNYLTMPEEKDARLPLACWILHNYKLWSEYMVRCAFCTETKKHVTSDRIRFVKEINALADYLTECVQILTDNTTSSWWS